MLEHYLTRYSHYWISNNCHDQVSHRKIYTHLILFSIWCKFRCQSIRPAWKSLNTKQLSVFFEHLNNKLSTLNQRLVEQSKSLRPSSSISLHNITILEKYGSLIHIRPTKFILLQRHDSFNFIFENLLYFRKGYGLALYMRFL